MAKPGWMKAREGEMPNRFKLCINCKFLGEPCGYTNNTGDGRKVMYSCPHSSVRIYDKTLACELYRRA